MPPLSPKFNEPHFVAFFEHLNLTYLYLFVNIYYKIRHFKIKKNIVNIEEKTFTEIIKYSQNL